LRAAQANPELFETRCEVDPDSCKPKFYYHKCCDAPPLHTAHRLRPAWNPRSAFCSGKVQPLAD